MVRLFFLFSYKSDLLTINYKTQHSYTFLYCKNQQEYSLA
ncbi:hypothetical protein HMPREF3232_01427 [Fannyhessea vaginae]|nr:hypothetical protein HMPREF3232_01427 [Fannyhessea vaginae]